MQKVTFEGGLFLLGRRQLVGLVVSWGLLREDGLGFRRLAVVAHFYFLGAVVVEIAVGLVGVSSAGLHMNIMTNEGIHGVE